MIFKYKKELVDGIDVSIEAMEKTVDSIKSVAESSFLKDNLPVPVSMVGGKRKILIDIRQLGSKVKENLQPFLKSVGVNEIDKDTLNGVVLANNDGPSDNSKLSAGSFWQVDATGGLSFVGSMDDLDNSPYTLLPTGNGGYKTQISTTGSLSEFSLRGKIPEQEFDSKVSGTLLLHERYGDWSFDVREPYSKSELENVSIGSTFVADIKTVYNFYDKNYESVISDDLRHEVLPNIYSFKEAQEHPENKENLKDITFDGAIHFNPSTYILDFSKLVSNSRNRLDVLSERRNPVKTFNTKELFWFAGTEETKYLFPMWAEIDFTTDTAGDICGILYDTELMDELVHRITIADSNGEFIDKHFAWSEESLTLEQGRVKTVNSRSVVSPFRSFDVGSWLENAALDQFSNLGIGREFLIGEGKKPDDITKALLSLVLKAKIDEWKKNNARTYGDIYAGELSKSETVLYSVFKYSGEDTSGIPVQKCFFANPRDFDRISMIDTQVKYNKPYTYVINAYKVVLGSEYTYIDKLVKGTIAVVPVVTTNVVKLIEVPIYQQTVRVVDDPPVSPDVVFYSFKGIPDKVTLAITSGVGKQLQDPIIIERSDVPKFNFARVSQGLKYGVPIQFKTESPIESFEVFRTEEKPRNYYDFHDKLITKVNTGTPASPWRLTSAATFSDKIESNRKYWYIVRCSDVHGNVSNPSAVFEVEMIEDAGNVVLYSNVFEFDSTDGKQATRAIRRFLQIRPSFEHRMISDKVNMNLQDAQIIEDVPDLKLGLSDEVPWKKRFAVLVTSRSSGKKILVRFEFDYSRVTEMKKV